MTIKHLAAPAVLALMIAAGLPAHAGGGKTTPVVCLPTPIICLPTPVKCAPTPACPPTPVKCNPAPTVAPKSAVPEPGSVALVGVGSLLLLPLGMRALKVRRQIS